MYSHFPHQSPKNSIGTMTCRCTQNQDKQQSHVALVAMATDGEARTRVAVTEESRYPCLDLLSCDGKL